MKNIEIGNIFGMDQDEFEKFKDDYYTDLYFRACMKKYYEDYEKPVSDAFFDKDNGYKIYRIETSYKEDENGNLTFVNQRHYWL